MSKSIGQTQRMIEAAATATLRGETVSILAADHAHALHLEQRMTDAGADMRLVTIASNYDNLRGTAKAHRELIDHYALDRLWDVDHKRALRWATRGDGAE